MCVVCREMKPRNQLFRLVKPSGARLLEANPEGALSGKGVYFCRQPKCIERLLQEKRIRKRFLERIAPSALDWLRTVLD